MGFCYAIGDGTVTGSHTPVHFQIAESIIPGVAGNGCRAGLAGGPLPIFQ